MKKMLYFMPFVLTPMLLLLCEWLDDTELIRMSPYLAGALLLIYSALMGFFSPANKSFDYLMTVFIPLSLFCCMFIAGLLDTSDLGTRFHLYKAVRAAFGPNVLMVYFLAACVTFLSSFKRFKRSGRA